ncbi:MAG: hypothetical protein WBA74_20395, partial [Cyclobacteriaceae bacterium]
IDYILLDCTRVTIGGEVYGDHCVVAGVTTVCTSTDIPPGIAPDDYPGPGGGPKPGNKGNRSNLCPHPTIEGLYIDCNTCAEGYEKDADENCVKQNPFKLCPESISFVQTGAGSTSEIVGLGASVYNKSRREFINAEFGNSCVTMYHSDPIIAAEIFTNRYNIARDSLAVWAYPKSTLLSSQVRQKLLDFLNQTLSGLGTISRRSCDGNIPISTAGYEVNCN